MSKKCKDHLGNEYNTIREMCKAWGIQQSRFTTRINKGMSLKDALETPVKSHSKNTNPEDHLGNRFNSRKEMCEYWGIKEDALKSRLKKGMTLEEALTTPVKERQWNTECTDHLGNHFKSIREMCRYHNINYQTYQRRIENGLSVEESLRGVEKHCVYDHKGIAYESIRQMCEAYGKACTTIQNRLNNGWSLEDALETDINARYGAVETLRVDHLGNRFRSNVELCKAYGINRHTLKQRLCYGWTLERALTTPADYGNRVSLDNSVIDHKGIVHRTFKDMCKMYNRPIATVRDRLKNGWTLEEALETEPFAREKIVE